jgi:hypothetical protein
MLGIIRMLMPGVVQLKYHYSSLEWLCAAQLAYHGGNISSSMDKLSTLSMHFAACAAAACSLLGVTAACEL